MMMRLRKGSHVSLVRYFWYSEAWQLIFALGEPSKAFAAMLNTWSAFSASQCLSPLGIYSIILISSKFGQSLKASSSIMKSKPTSALKMSLPVSLK